MITTSRSFLPAQSTALRATRTGFFSPSMRNTGTPTCSPTMRELLDGRGTLEVAGDQHRVLALGEYRLASLPQVVVLPEPWRPAIMMIVGGGLT